MISSIGFDLDGTLFDYKGSVESALLEWANNRNWNSSKVSEFWKQGEQEFYPKYLKGEISFNEQRLERVRYLYKNLGSEISQNDVQSGVDEWLFLFKKNWKAFPEVRISLRKAQDTGFKLGVLTNGNLDQQLDKLAAIGISDFFKTVVASESIGISKPDPFPFQYLCRELESQEDQTVYIGDSFETDILGATNAGLKAIWVNRSGEPERENHYQTADLEEIFHLITEI